MTWKTMVLGLVFLGACGIPDGTKLSDLSSDDMKQLCAELEEEKKDCGDGLTMSRSASDCEELECPDDADATVGDWRACNEVDVCDALTDDACKPILKCATK